MLLRVSSFIYIYIRQCSDINWSCVEQTGNDRNRKRRRTNWMYRNEHNVVINTADENCVIVPRPDTCGLPNNHFSRFKYKIEFNPREQTSFVNVFRNFYEIDFNKTKTKSVVRFLIDYNNCMFILFLLFWNFFWCTIYGSNIVQHKPYYMFIVLVIGKYRLYINCILYIYV